MNDNVDEDFVLNSEWAVCAGLSLKEVNRIEKRFLEAIVSIIFNCDRKSTLTNVDVIPQIYIPPPNYHYKERTF